MNKAICDYCGHVFTSEEIDEGESHLALARVELRCPQCFSYNIVDLRDIVEDMGNVSKETDS